METITIVYENTPYNLADAAINHLNGIDELRAYYTRQAPLVKAWGRAPTCFVYDQPMLAGFYYFDGVHFEAALRYYIGEFSATTLQTVALLADALAPVEHDLGVRAYFGCTRDRRVGCMIGLPVGPRGENGYTSLEIEIHEAEVSVKRSQFAIKVDVTNSVAADALAAVIAEQLRLDKNYCAWAKRT